MDSSDKTLKWLTNGLTTPHIIVNAVSNSVVFSSEDANGTVLTNHQNNRVIGMVLQIYQLDDPTITIQPGGLFDYYRIHTRMTRRTLE